MRWEYRHARQSGPSGTSLARTPVQPPRRPCLPPSEPSPTAALLTSNTSPTLTCLLISYRSSVTCACPHLPIDLPLLPIPALLVRPIRTRPRRIRTQSPHPPKQCPSLSPCPGPPRPWSSRLHPSTPPRPQGSGSGSGSASAPSPCPAPLLLLTPAPALILLSAPPVSPGQCRGPDAAAPPVPDTPDPAQKAGERRTLTAPRACPGSRLSPLRTVRADLLRLMGVPRQPPLPRLSRLGPPHGLLQTLHRPGPIWGRWLQPMPQQHQRRTCPSMGTQAVRASVRSFEHWPRLSGSRRPLAPYSQSQSHDPPVMLGGGENGRAISPGKVRDRIRRAGPPRRLCSLLLLRSGWARVQVRWSGPYRARRSPRAWTWSPYPVRPTPPTQAPFIPPPRLPRPRSSLYSHSTRSPLPLSVRARVRIRSRRPTLDRHRACRLCPRCWVPRHWGSLLSRDCRGGIRPCCAGGVAG